MGALLLSGVQVTPLRSFLAMGSYPTVSIANTRTIWR